MAPKIPFPIPDDIHKYAFMDDPSATHISFPKNRLGSDHKLEYPFVAEFDASDPLKLIEQCKDGANCPVSEIIKYGGVGSGHFQHAGRPGQVGGSAPSGRAVSKAPSSREGFTTPAKGAGTPGSPTFVGPPAPSVSNGGRSTLDINASLRNIADNVLDTDIDSSPDFSPDGQESSEFNDIMSEILANQTIPTFVKDVVNQIKDFALDRIAGFQSPLGNFLRNLRKEVGLPGKVVDESKITTEIDTFKREIEEITHEEVSANVMRSLVSQFKKTFIDPEIVSQIADQILNGEIKQRAAAISQAFLGAKEAIKTGAKEEKATLKADKEAAKQIAKQEKAAAKAIEKEEKAIAKTAKEKKKAKEKAAKAIKKAEEKEKKAIATAEKKEFDRVNEVTKRRFVRGKVQPPEEAPVATLLDIDQVITDIENEEIPIDEVADFVNSALSGTSGSDRDEAIEQLRGAGIISASATAGGGSKDMITNKNTIPPVEIEPEPEIESKEECQALVTEAIREGRLSSDANILEIITELRDDCPDIADFVKILLEDSNNKEQDIETLISDGFATRNDAGEVFITDNDTITPVKIEENLIKNTEIDIYKLAEACPTTQNNGCPLFLSAFAENTTRDLGWKEIFEFDDTSLLDIIISNFYKLKDTLNPPIKLGHDEKQALVQNSGFPSAGWITDLKRKTATNKLLAYFSNVPEAIIKLIESGSYKRLSAELYNNYIDPVTKEEFGPTMRAVSILGADVPRIKTLEDLTVIYHSDKLPYKILSEEKNMFTPIQKLQETVKALKQNVIDVTKLTDEQGTLVRGDGSSSLIQSLKQRIAELEEQIVAMRSAGADKGDGGNVPSSLQLSERVKSQEDVIYKLSESVKTIGSELQNANVHILDTKKNSFRSINGRIYTPAFIDKALELSNFAEDENKVLELIELMTKLQDDNALFLSEPAEIEEELKDPKVLKLSQDKLHNEVLALSEKEKITYTEAFDRVLLLKKA